MLTEILLTLSDALHLYLFVWAPFSVGITLGVILGIYLCHLENPID